MNKELNNLEIIERVYFDSLIYVHCECGRRLGVIDRRELYKKSRTFECLPEHDKPWVKYCYRKFDVALTNEQIEKEKLAWKKIEEVQKIIEDVKKILTNFFE